MNTSTSVRSAIEGYAPDHKSLVFDLVTSTGRNRVSVYLAVQDAVSAGLAVVEGKVPGRTRANVYRRTAAAPSPIRGSRAHATPRTEATAAAARDVGHADGRPGRRRQPDRLPAAGRAPGDGADAAQLSAVAGRHARASGTGDRQPEAGVTGPTASAPLTPGKVYRLAQVSERPGPSVPPGMGVSL